ITDSVVNLVHAERPIRLRVTLQVAAGIDVDAVRRLLLDAAAAHREVLQEPAPQVLLVSLGGDAMSFDLCVWHEARGPLRQQLKSELNFAIAERVRAQGI